MAEPNLRASAANMRAACAAKERHDRTCPYKRPGIELHMSPFDLERLGWAEGDDVCGMRVVAQPGVQPHRMRVVCDGEPEHEGPGRVAAVGRELAAA